MVGRPRADSRVNVKQIVSQQVIMTAPIATVPCRSCRLYRRALAAMLAVLAISGWVMGSP